MNKKLSIILSLVIIITIAVVLGLFYFQRVQLNNNQSNIIDLAKKLKVGDYVNYGDLIDDNTYIAKKDKTGLDKDKEIKTEKKYWRVLNIDKKTGEILITTEGVVNDGLYFKGSKGYVNGIEELDSICKNLYSSSFLGLEARSMNVDDLNYICNYVPEYKDRYAFYPYSSLDNFSNSTNITFNNNSYIKIRHYMGPNEEGIFYDSDGGGIECIDEDGYVYSTSSKDNPVCITRTSYRYNLENKIVKEILGEDFGWLASKYISMQTNWSESYATYGIRAANAKGVTGADLFGSRDINYEVYSGIRPVVLLNSTIVIDNSNNKLDGSTVETAWKLINKDELTDEMNQNIDAESTPILNNNDNQSINELTSKLKIGDYVNYGELIDNNSYNTNKEKTGHDESQELKTEKKNWRVLSIDENTGEVLITTNGIVNDKIHLGGAKGYFNGADELHKICEELYSSTKLGVKARSLKVEDLNKVCGYTLPEAERYAIYPYEIKVSGTEIYNGKEYKKVTRNIMADMIPRYLKDAIDGGGTNEGITEEGYKYVEIGKESPIYITKSSYSCNLNKDNVIVSKILIGSDGYDYGWLASPCIDVSRFFRWYSIWWKI